jgi:Skp family chaperone for outer membrane proteins
MLRVIKITALASAILAGSIFAVDYAVGVINVKDIMQNSSRIKAESTKLKQKFSKQTSEIESLRRSLVADVQQMRKNSAVMSKNDKAKREKELMAREQVLSKKQGSFSKSLMQAQQEIMRHVQADFEDIAKNVAKKKKLSLVLDQNGQVLYVSSQYNLTDLAKKKFN